MPSASLHTHHPGRAIVAYWLVTLGPTALSVGLLAGVGVGTGTDFGLLAFAATLFVLREINVFLVSAVYHRGAAHRACRFHPTFHVLLRLWGWLFLGSGTRTWAWVHRLHHAHSDRAEDPHSPNKPGESLWSIGRQSIGAFRAVSREPERPAFLGDLPDDALERFFEWDFRQNMGVTGLRFPILIGLIVAVWVGLGTPVWVAVLAALATLPGITFNVLAGTVLLVNGVSHLWGYQNYPDIDRSHNVLGFDLLNFGEALHNNHHAAPRCARMSVRPGELDLGYAVLVGLKRVGLVTDLVNERPEH